MQDIVNLWIGDDNQGRFLTQQDKAMDSLIYYYGAKSPLIKYNFKWLFLDNGAYTAIRNNLELEPERVKDIQEKIQPDYTIPLDYPFIPGIPQKVMEERWKGSARNILSWQETTNLKGLVPMLHAWSVNSLIQNVKWLQKYADAEYVGVGSVVHNGFTEYRGYFGDRQPSKRLIDMLISTIQTIRKYSDFRIHMAGFGSSPLMLFLGFYCGIDSTDTAGYKRKAAFGKIILPGRGDRHIGRSDATWGTTKLRDDERLLLEKCGCPICRENPANLWCDWKARAIHNKYVLQTEEKKARELLTEGIDTLEKHMDIIFSNSGLKYLWKYTKLRVSYQPIDLWYVK